MKENQQDVFTRRMFIKGMATSFGALPVFAWPRWAQAFYYNLGFFKKGSVPSAYVEDVFSTYNYSGNGSTQTITNGIDLAGQGGLVWLKQRTAVSWTAFTHHNLFDSARGYTKIHQSSRTNAEDSLGSPAVIASSTGFSIDSDGSGFGYNKSTENYTSWTFRKAANFFDVVTWTGNGTSNRQITHSLGVSPGMILVKCRDTGYGWVVWHRSLSNGNWLALNTTMAQNANSNYFGTNNSLQTSSHFNVGSGNGEVNQNGNAYIAYLFAHDTGTNGVIQCGSYISDAGASTPAINLGWEPQFVLIKRSEGGTANWFVFDNMRGAPMGADNTLYPNLTNAEYTSDNFITFLPTGFQPQQGASGVNDGSNSVYTYMAIRRGPMKVPTDATKVFNAVTYVGNSTAQRFTPGFVTDLSIRQVQNSAGNNTIVTDRLRGGSYLHTTGTFAEQVNSGSIWTTWDYMDGIQKGSSENETGTSNVRWLFRRAPGFMDVVCWTSTGSSPTTITHSLGVVPEFIIVKSRTVSGSSWIVYVASQGKDKYLTLNSTNGVSNSVNRFGSAPPTSTNFGIDELNVIGAAGEKGVAYLFASCPGVSKVGTFAGAATDVTVDCGFSGQPRFVLVKRTDAVSDWIVVDSTRGTSVYLALNSTNAETSAIVITFTTGGFVAKAGTVANAASGANYIFMAIA